MEENELQKWQILYLRGVRFKDNNMMDYRLYGRPYIVYKITNDKVYLFQVRSDKRKIAEEFFIPIKIGKRDCNVNLRYIYKLEKAELIKNVNSVRASIPKGEKSRVRYLDDKYRKKIEKEIKVLCTIEKYREQFEDIPQ